MIDFVRKGKNTSDATATANDILSPKTAYANNEKITGNILTTAIASSLNLATNELELSAQSTNILDYIIDFNSDFVISSADLSNILNINVKNKNLIKIININQIKNNCILLCAKFFNILNNTDEIGILMVLQDISTKQIYFSVVNLDKNTLDETNITVNSTIDIITANVYCNIIYNSIKKCFAIILRSYNTNQYLYVHIIDCSNGQITQLCESEIFLYENISGSQEPIIDGYWNNDGTRLLLHGMYIGIFGGERYYSYLLNFTSSLMSVTTIKISDTNVPVCFLDNFHLMDGNNNLYLINENNITLLKTIENINITNKSIYDKIITLDNIYYLYFNVNRNKIIVYKYNDIFSFTFENEIDWDINSTNALYSYLLYCPMYNANKVYFSQNFKVKEMYTTTDNPNFATLERNNVKYFNTSDADAIAADISSGKTAYVNGQKVIGTATILNGQEKTITPTTQEQIITPDSNYNALNQVTISAVTNNIDSNIIPENIKAGVTILGVTGTYTGEAINEEVEGG